MFRILAMAGLALAVPAGGAMAASPYRLLATTPLPAMPEGDFDQLVADVPHDRLYVSAEDGATIDVFSLKTGALLHAGGAVASPHKIVWDAAHGHLLIADGDGSVKILAPDLSTVAHVPVGPKPDTGVFDAAHHLFYVSSRDPKAPDSQSLISAIATDDLAVKARYTLPATTLKGLTLDATGHRLLVSMRDKDAIGVVHLDTAQVEVWHPTGVHKPVPLLLDPASRTLYAGSRGPGELEVLDATDGHVRATLPSTETSDSVSFDRANGLIYVSGDSGMSRYRIDAKGEAELLETDAALVGKTSLYVPELRRLYVMRPKKGATVAALTMFAVTP